ncbi:hypothetical protein [Kineococcus sp. NPDC059986]
MGSSRRPLLPGRDGPWRVLDDVEQAVTDDIAWYSTRRLHGDLEGVAAA